MRKLAVLFPIMTVALLALGACNGSSAKQAEGEPVSTDKPVKEKEKYAIEITRDYFLKNILDYTKGADNMKYLGDKPAIVDFWASWCGPCRIAGPILEELAKEYDGQIYVYKVNTQTEQQIAGELGIQSIPTFIFFPVDGKPFATSGIARTPEETKKMFKEIIDKELLKKSK
ncbi:thioredoxin family protein [Tenuifilum thalassicum]|jgi:thioredoxin|uniref:Thiol reductase thioredoxin n=1 Tax=Tenuifilum thalassicum TaxID=2590900 RepID=A0A7D4CFI5_9BACT|nr:thioredoxin domain-containing protein [Tenuifilum thalassicum]QKG79066.1 thiol reductase thioredoxin [Tenuifilum thalassicum]